MKKFIFIPALLLTVSTLSTYAAAEADPVVGPGAGGMGAAPVKIVLPDTPNELRGTILKLAGVTDVSNGILKSSDARAAFIKFVDTFLPEGADLSRFPPHMIQAGKNGVIRMFEENELGKRSAGEQLEYLAILTEMHDKMLARSRVAEAAKVAGASSAQMTRAEALSVRNQGHADQQEIEVLPMVRDSSAQAKVQPAEQKVD